MESTRLRQLQKSGEANMQLICGAFFFFSTYASCHNTILVEEGDGGLEGWGLPNSGSRETEEAMVWPSLTFFYIPQPLPHLPPIHCSGNPRQHILNSNTDCQGYLTCVGSSQNWIKQK